MAKRKSSGVNVLASEAVMVRADLLQPHPRNARQGDVGAICESIKANGFYRPIVVQQSTGYILAGNHSWMAARQLGMPEVPVSYIDCDDDRALRIMLVDNRANDLADYANDKLASLLQELITETGTLEGTGFDGDALDELLADLGMEQTVATGNTPEDEAPEPPEAPVSVLGDLWLLGGHRVSCGDSTSSEAVSRLLCEDSGKRPFLMVTDPPYGVEYDPEWRDRYEAGAKKTSFGKPKTKFVGNRATGKVSNDDRVDWSPAWALFPGDVAYVWHAGVYAAGVAISLFVEGFEIRNQIIWRKQHFVFGRGAYHWQHEPCWYAVRHGRTANWKGDRTQTTVWDVANMNPMGRNKEEGEATGHGTQKPVELMRRPILNHTEPGDAVYDPFLGSGSTLIAAESTGRICYGNELDPKYVDVIVRRWQDFTGKAAVLEGDGRTFDEIRAERTGVADSGRTESGEAVAASAA